MKSSICFIFCIARCLLMLDVYIYIYVARGLLMLVLYIYIYVRVHVDINIKVVLPVYPLVKILAFLHKYLPIDF